MATLVLATEQIIRSGIHFAKVTNIDVGNQTNPANFTWYALSPPPVSLPNTEPDAKLPTLPIVVYELEI